MNANDLKIGKSFPHGDKIEGGRKAKIIYYQIWLVWWLASIFTINQHYTARGIWLVSYIVAL